MSRKSTWQVLAGCQKCCGCSSSPRRTRYLFIGFPRSLGEHPVQSLDSTQNFGRILCQGRTVIMWVILLELKVDWICDYDQKLLFSRKLPKKKIYSKLLINASSSYSMKFRIFYVFHLFSSQCRPSCIRLEVKRERQLTAAALWNNDNDFSELIRLYEESIKRINMYKTRQKE